MAIKKTKIVCTIGPSSADGKVLNQLIKSGMSIARLNFSHGDLKMQSKLIRAIRQQSKKLKSSVTIVQDLPWPRIQVTQIAKSGQELFDQEKIIIVANYDLADINTAGLAYNAVPIDRSLAANLKKSDRILINNSQVQLLVEKIEDDLVYTKVLQGGIINSGDEVIVPGKINDSKIPNEDILAAIKLKPDYLSLALSNSAQLKAVRKLLKNSPVKLLIKLETLTQVKLIIKLLKLADGLFFNHQRLGWEIPKNKLDIIEKDLVRYCYRMKKIVIVTDKI